MMTQWCRNSSLNKHFWDKCLSTCRGLWLQNKMSYDFSAHTISNYYKALSARSREGKLHSTHQTGCTVNAFEALKGLSHLARNKSHAPMPICIPIQSSSLKTSLSRTLPPVFSTFLFQALPPLILPSPQVKKPEAF